MLLLMNFCHTKWDLQFVVDVEICPGDAQRRFCVMVVGRTTLDVSANSAGCIPEGSGKCFNFNDFKIDCSILGWF